MLRINKKLKLCLKTQIVGYGKKPYLALFMDFPSSTFCIINTLHKYCKFAVNHLKVQGLYEKLTLCNLQFFAVYRSGSMEANTVQDSHYVTEIKEYIQVICRTDDMHALIVEGPPGWGKTSAVEEALKLSGYKNKHLGAYSTSLNLYHFLYTYPSHIILLDDCSGLFNDSSAMAILKASTWPSENNRRIVRWGSTSSKVLVPEFQFRGKLIIVCNYFPSTPDGAAIRSRGYVRRIDVSVEEAKKLLITGAQEKKYFPNTELASQVANFLLERLTKSTLPHISFRTLKKGYHLAEVHPNSWQKLFEYTLPNEKSVKPEEIIKDLAQQNLKVKDQLKIFQQQTGMQERSFYNYRKELKISWKDKTN